METAFRRRARLALLSEAPTCSLLFFCTRGIICRGQLSDSMETAAKTLCKLDGCKVLPESARAEEQASISLWCNRPNAWRQMFALVSTYAAMHTPHIQCIRVLGMLLEAVATVVLDICTSSCCSFAQVTRIELALPNGTLASVTPASHAHLWRALQVRTKLLV